MTSQLPDFEFSSFDIEELIRTPESSLTPVIPTPVSPSSTSIKASHAILPKLASEILIRIYGNLDDFTSVLALSSVSRQFREFWITNSTSTCPSVLSHTIFCAKQAKEFIDIKRAYNSPRATWDRHRLAIEQTQEILRNHRIAIIALENFESTALDELQARIDGTHRDAATEIHNEIFKQKAELLTIGANRHDFLAAFYRFMTLCSLPPYLWDQTLQPYTSWTMLELERVEALLTWFRDGPIHSRLHLAIQRRLSNHYGDWIQSLIDKLRALMHFQLGKAMLEKEFHEAFQGEKNVCRYLMLDEYYNANGWGRGPRVGEVLAEMDAARENQDGPDVKDKPAVHPNHQARSTWNLYTNPHHNNLYTDAGEVAARREREQYY